MLTGPSSHDPFGQEKEIVGLRLVDTVLHNLTVNDCIKLALEQLEKQERDCTRQIRDRLKEAQFWLWESDRLAHQATRGTPVPPDDLTD